MKKITSERWKDSISLCCLHSYEKLNIYIYCICGGHRAKTGNAAFVGFIHLYFYSWRTKKKEGIKPRVLTFGWSACCRLTWIHHLYLWQNSVPFCCPAANKWSFFRTLTVSLELPGTLWSTEIGISPCILSTPHIKQALLQPAKSIWLMAEFHPQPFYPEMFRVWVFGVVAIIIYCMLGDGVNCYKSIYP